MVLKVLHPVPDGARRRTPALDADTLLRNVLETMPGGVFTVDAAGTVTSWNRGMEELTGYPAEHALGRSCSFLDGSTCFTGHGSTGGGPCPLFTSGCVHGKRCSIRRKDGSRASVLKNARVMVAPEGHVIGGIEVVTDVGDVLRLEAQIDRLRVEAGSRSGIVGEHPSMRKLREVVRLAAAARAPVLVTGETGTGKEVVARAIHEASERRGGPFVRVSCTALSEPLLDRELFGRTRGAFTEAGSERRGGFEAAHGGTLFLDEIADVSPAVQVKLLRALDEREIQPEGGDRTIAVDVRVIAATNQDLLALVERDRLRPELYHRLAVIPVHVPPLRERSSDVPVLVTHFLERLNRSLGRSVVGFTEAALARLHAYPWPGNVRELEHAVEYAMSLCPGDEIAESCLPPAVTLGAPPPALHGGVHRHPGNERILEALRDAAGNRTEAARVLGVSRVTLWKWLKRIDPRLG